MRLYIVDESETDEVQVVDIPDYKPTGCIRVFTTRENAQQCRLLQQAIREIQYEDRL